jgi:O-antigen/teichoic acid export membrane protein
LIKRHRQVLAVMGLFACVQGGILISQLLTPLYLAPSQVGTIRTLESTLALLILAASMGMPPLAVRAGAEHGRAEVNGDLLSQLLITALFAGSLTWSLSWLASPWLERFGGRQLAEIAGLCVLTNLTRVIAGFVQGAVMQLVVVRTLLLLTVLAIAILFWMTRLWGIDGWVAGRYVGESLLVVGLVYLLRGHLLECFGKPASLRPSRRMLAEGVTLNFASFVRLVCDSLPFLLLVGIGGSGDDVAYLGIAQLLLVAPNLLFAILSQVYLPRLILEHVDGVDSSSALKKLASSLAGIACAYTLCLIAGRLVVMFTWPQYQRALDLALLMTPSLLFRSGALTLGGWMMASRHYVFSLYANIAELVVGGAAALALVHYAATAGAAIAVCGSALCSVSFHFVFWKKLKDR